MEYTISGANVVVMAVAVWFVGAFFNDIVNAMVIKTFLAMPFMQMGAP